ncbi:alpha/beta fold hydrolase [Amycolatopsis sp. NPDC005232]|uniref:alpha/beta hydrolase family protein n=1 Tax=Amycolatopsis sp. NPDC005232 TaxID=3157027 RepID=UPI0033B61820
MRKRSLIAVFTAALCLLGSVPATAAPRLHLPVPSGRHAVGTQDRYLVDRKREEPWTGGPRELMITLTYPALPGGRPAPYLPDGIAAAVNAQAHAALGAGPFDFGFTTPARAGATMLPGRHPVLLYSPGAQSSRLLGTVLVEQLASEGYVVISLDHTHDALAVDLPGGRVEPSTLPPSSEAVNRKLIATRVADVEFVLDRLGLDRLGMFGHSAGGFTAAEVMAADPRVVAGANLDGSMVFNAAEGRFGRAATEGLDRPFLLMSAGDHSSVTDPSWTSFVSHQRGPLVDLHEPAGEHGSFTDYQAWLPQLGADPAKVRAVIGDVDPETMLRKEKAALSGFFDAHLRKRRDLNPR